MSWRRQRGGDRDRRDSARGGGETLLDGQPSGQR